MPTVRLGNRAALDRGQILSGNRVTTVLIVDDDPLESRVRTVAHADGLWPTVSAAPPVWVTCEDPDLQAALADAFGCPVGQPEGW